MPQGWRRRRGRSGRLPKPVRLSRIPVIEGFVPIPPSEDVPIYINSVEIEALKLVDLQNLSQKEAGEMMGISRGTVWRLLQSAREKTVKALTEARPLIVTKINRSDAR